MTLDTWILFFFAYLLITLSPGPNVLLVIKNAVKYGYRAASMTILMNLTCQLLIILSVALGAGTLLEKSPMLFFSLKVIGGGYLIFLGISGLLSKRTNHTSIKSTSQTQLTCSNKVSYRTLCKEAFLVSASNPKTIIFLSAFLPQFISTNNSISIQFTIMFLTIAFIVTSVHLAYSILAKNVTKQWSNLRESQWITKFTHSAFIAFGCGVISSSRAT